MCFIEGTSILCFQPIPDYKEKYIPIEELRVGDLVKTLRHGYRRISMIWRGKMQNNTQNIWESIYSCDKLLLTGGHGVFEDDIHPRCVSKCEDKYIVPANQSLRFFPIDGTRSFYTYHIALESDGDDFRRFGVWANGVLVETSTIHHFIHNNYTSHTN